MGAVHLYVLLLVTVFLHNGHSGSLDDEPLNFSKQMSLIISIYYTCRVYKTLY